MNSVPTERDWDVANTIIKQIKATDFWFLARIGYNSPSYTKNSLTFKVRGAKVGYANVKITLNSMDTYDVEVFKVRRSKLDIKITTVYESSEGVYFDGLVQVLKYAVDGN